MTMMWQGIEKKVDSFSDDIIASDGLVVFKKDAGSGVGGGGVNKAKGSGPPLPNYKFMWS